MHAWRLGHLRPRVPLTLDLSVCLYGGMPVRSLTILCPSVSLAASARFETHLPSISVKHPVARRLRCPSGAHQVPIRCPSGAHQVPMSRFSLSTSRRVACGEEATPRRVEVVVPSVAASRGDLGTLPRMQQR